MAELKNTRYEKYVQGLATGLSQRKAYRAAFPNSERWKDATVDKRASELYNTGEIMGRLQELMEQSTSEAIMTATKRKEWLTKVVLSDTEETKDKLKAVDILNRMDGEYTDKVILNGQVNNPFEGLTTDELKKMVNSE